ncbi:MAG: FliM/FliN family flagellar motor switch protein [Anaerovoracaceae bacterium]
MAEILSQSQIDMLLNNLTREASEESIPERGGSKKIREYDFRSPKHFTREQLKLLFSIYENYARILSSYATGVLQTYCSIEIVEVEEQQYYEFNNALPDSVLMGLIDLAVKDTERDEDLVLIDVSKDIGYCVIDRLLGGSGVPLEADREYSDIELGLLEHFIKGMVNLMKNVWFDQVEMAPWLMKTETNSRIIQGISADENVVIIVMNFLLNETQGKLNICIPAITLDMLFKKKTIQSKKNMRKSDHLSEAQRRADIIKEISKSELEITGVLGTAEVLLKELMDLEVGDIIKLNKAAGAMIDLVVEETTWLRGNMGISNKKRASMIQETLHKGVTL